MVSVCIPTFNRSSLLREAIVSVLAQTYGDFELIVSDNASTDDTEALVRSYGDRRIRYVRNEKNLGHRENWNNCLRLARGTYIAILPDDDLMLPENIARKLRVLETDSQIGLVHSKYHLIDHSGRVTTHDTNWGHGPDRMNDAVEDREDLLTRPYNVINISTALFRRSCYERLGGFTDRLKFAFDWEYLLRIALEWKIYFLAQPLVSWRVHSSSITTLSVNDQISKVQEELATKRVFCQHLNKIDGASTLKKKIRSRMAAKVAAQAEAMFNAGAPDKEIKRFLVRVFRAYPQLIGHRELWRVSAKAVLGRGAVRALRRFS